MDDPIIPFGKCKGQHASELPPEYALWLMTQMTYMTRAHRPLLIAISRNTAAYLLALAAELEERTAQEVNQFI